ncbi:MAG: phosphoribosylformylglycinamidine synthase, partial [Candidatus Latescibacteria bacterium]|nr:phosphoribosylformylglycinamidine synthase [Candidatus Latescibacterota bacterium]
MVRRITVSTRPDFIDSYGEGVLKDIHDLGVNGVTGVCVSNVYLFEGDISDNDIRRIADELLSDFVTQEYHLDTIPEDEGHVVEVAYNHGVMDPVEGSIYKALKDMDINSVTAAKTMKRYVISGKAIPA